uniref:Uncharacterized protein n=1 Tax=Poecilia mexicana TaxID=48701 RepID=A0A3B3X3A0_9TELE
MLQFFLLLVFSSPVFSPLQWVLAFEIFIPLVLFFILLGLRQKKPAIPVKEGMQDGDCSKLCVHVHPIKVCEAHTDIWKETPQLSFMCDFQSFVQEQ